MINEEQRDELLQLCQKSKECSNHYDRVAEINNDIEALPEYLRKGFTYTPVAELSDNLDQSLLDITNYINEELLDNPEDLIEDKGSCYVCKKRLYGDICNHCGTSNI